MVKSLRFVAKRSCPTLPSSWCVCVQPSDLADYLLLRTSCPQGRVMRCAERIGSIRLAALHDSARLDLGVESEQIMRDYLKTRIKDTIRSRYTTWRLLCSSLLSMNGFLTGDFDILPDHPERNYNGVSRYRFRSTAGRGI